MIEECLARYDTDPSSLVASVDAVIGLRQGDLLLAVGSAAEGLGNSKSDIDLLLVAGDGGGQRAETERCWAIGRSMVDLRIIRATTAEALTRRLHEWAGLPWNLLELAPFSYDERLLLHRLLDGHAMYPVQAGRARPGGRRELARLKLQVARHMARTIQVDMVGYRDERDYMSLVFAAQDLLGHGVDGLLAAHGITNPNPKWRSRLLERLPAGWDRPLMVRPADPRASRVVWDLHRAPPEPERESAVRHAVRCVSFARAAFAWAEPRLVAGTAFGSFAGTWERAERGSREQPLPSLEFDVDFFFSGSGNSGNSGNEVAVARLNEFGASLRLPEREFALLLLLDGQTSAVEAESVIGGAVDVGGTVELLARSGWLLEPQQPGMVRV